MSAFEKQPNFQALELMLADNTRRLSIDEAIDLMSKIYAAIESVEDFRLKLKWCLGFVVVHLNCPRIGRRRAIALLSERLWEQREIRASVASLYECATFVRSFDAQLPRFEIWARDTKAFLGRPLLWSDIQDMILGGRSNARVIGREAADQRDVRAIEHATEAIDGLLKRERDYDGDEEVQGVLEGFRQSVEGLARQRPRAAATPRSEEYRRFVRRYGCAVCERPADAHHAFGEKGTGSKASDFTCVPLCREHHAKWHQLGPGRFEEKFDIQLLEVAFNLLHRFVAGTWVTMVLTEAGGE